MKVYIKYFHIMKWGPFLYYMISYPEDPSIPDYSLHGRLSDAFFPPEGLSQEVENTSGAEGIQYSFPLFIPPSLCGGRER